MPLRFGVLFLLSLLFSFFDQKNGIGKIVHLDSGEDENGESEAKSIGRDKRNRIGIFPALFSFLFFFFSPPPRWKNEAANWIQVTPFFSSIYHPYTLSLLLDQPIVVRNGQRDSTWKIIRIECGYFPSPLARIFIFFSAFGNVGKRSSIVIILFNPV